MPRIKPGFEKKICLAALRLIAGQGWATLTLESAARAAKIPAAQLRKKFSTKNDLLPALARHVTEETIAAAGKPDDRRGSPHDRLFEVMMARFDVLQRHRRAMLHIADGIIRDSDAACKLLLAQGKEMQRMLTLAGLERPGPCAPLAVLGLELVYLATLRVWKSDETLDMTKTMAVLDRGLRYASRAAETIFRNH